MTIPQVPSPKQPRYISLCIGVKEDVQDSGKVARLEKQIAKHKEMKAKECPPDKSPIFIRIEK
jgi:hypothetical protein